MVTALVFLAVSLLLYTGVTYAVRRRREQTPVPIVTAVERLPAAVVSLLLHKGKLQPAVVEETVFALVRGGWLRSVRQDDGTPAVHYAQQPGTEPLRHFEHLVLERVGRRAGRLPQVPVSALGPGEGDDWTTWWNAFEKSVRAEAVAAGLARAADGPAVQGIGCAAVVPVWLALTAVVHELGPSLIPALFMALFGVLFLVGPIAAVLQGPQLTPQGEQAAAWWRGAAASTGLWPPADEVSGPVAGPAAPELAADQVWSSYGGRWRVVRIGGLHGPRWGRPSNLVLLAVPTAIATAVLSAVVQGPQNGVVIALPSCLFVLLLARWIPAYSRIRAAPDDAAFQGAIVRRWTYETSSDDSSTTHYCCSIDDGSSPTAWSFHVKRSFWDGVRVGDIVHVTCSPRWHRLRAIVVVEAVPR